ncbi:hypothetical protein, partial [Xanthomonas hortorum]
WPHSLADYVASKAKREFALPKQLLLSSKLATHAKKSSPLFVTNLSEQPSDIEETGQVTTPQIFVTVAQGGDY